MTKASPIYSIYIAYIAYNIDTGFEQVDQSISHHDMWDYLELTQKGYSKAFEPVHELLTQLISEMEGELCRPEAEGCAAD